MVEITLVGASCDLSHEYYKVSNVAASVIRKICQRDEFGQNKYGVTLDRTDLTREQWLTHLQEELLDGAHYIERSR